MNALSPAARERLAKLCGMLGSNFDGERANAAALATRVLREAGLSWGDLLAAREPEQALRRRAPADWRETVRRCRAAPHALRPWERDFLAGLDQFPRLSAKQSFILREISARALGA